MFAAGGLFAACKGWRGEAGGEELVLYAFPIPTQESRLVQHVSTRCESHVGWTGIGESKRESSLPQNEAFPLTSQLVGFLGIFK